MAIPPDLSAYKSFIEEGQAGYEAPLGQLGMVDPGIRYDPRQHSYASDLYQYYLSGGMPLAGTTGITTQVPETTVQGTGGAGITAAGVAAPPVGAANPLTQMITTPTGETMTVKEAMTRDPAYRLPGTVAPSAGISYEDDLVGVQPPITDLERMARAQTATDPRYAADVKSGIIDESPWAGEIETEMMGRRNVPDYMGLPGYAPEFREFDTREGTQYQVPFEGARTVVPVPIPSEENLMYGDIDPAYGMDEVTRQQPVINPFEETRAAGQLNPPGDLLRGDILGEGMPEITRQQQILPEARTETAYRDPIMDMVPPTNITLPSGDIFAANDPTLIEKVDPETRTNTNMIAGLWDEAAGNIETFKTSLQDAGNLSINQIGSLVNAFTQGATTLNIAGAAGIPGMIIAALAGAHTQVTPEQKAANAAFEAEQGITVGADGRITSGPLQGKIPPGKSFAGSATYEEQINKKIDSIENRKAPQTDASREKIKELEDMKAGAIEEAPTGVVKPGDIDFAQERTPENIAKATEDLADQYDREVEAGERTSDPTVTSNINKAKAVVNMPQHLGDVGQGDPTGGRADEPAPSRPGGAPASGPHGNGGDAGDSGGKIVCTMMNDSYGFGSFRNKIWLRHSKTLPMEYQLGYHALFLPLVKFSKREGLINKAMKKVLEHIAVHRTIDIRQEARGKKHMLGRVYRKILEPICYWVGRHGKRT